MKSIRYRYLKPVCELHFSLVVKFGSTGEIEPQLRIIAKTEGGSQSREVSLEGILEYRSIPSSIRANFKSEKEKTQLLSLTPLEVVEEALRVALEPKASVFLTGEIETIELYVTFGEKGRPNFSEFTVNRPLEMFEGIFADPEAIPTSAATFNSSQARQGSAKT